MSSRIRGRKRREVIEKWLSGVEDPDIEVIPTKSEGRYIVKQRTSHVDTQEDLSNEMTDVSNEVSNEMATKDDDEMKPKIDDDKKDIEIPKESKPKHKDKNKSKLYDYMSSEILTELKLLRDQYSRINEREERKREMKRITKKCIAKNNETIKKEIIDELPPPQVVREQYTPTITRRRINLLQQFV